MESAINAPYERRRCVIGDVNDKISSLHMPLLQLGPQGLERDVLSTQHHPVTLHQVEVSGIDSLAGVVRSVLKGDPLSGDLFVFKTLRADKLKILAWMGDGFALYLRRLEKGTFAFPTASDASVLVTPTQLAMILGGLDPAKARERLRYKTPA